MQPERFALDAPCGSEFALPGGSVTWPRIAGNSLRGSARPQPWVSPARCLGDTIPRSFGTTGCTLFAGPGVSRRSSGSCADRLTAFDRVTGGLCSDHPRHLQPREPLPPWQRRRAGLRRGLRGQAHGPGRGHHRAGTDVLAVQEVGEPEALADLVDRLDGA